MAPLLSLLYTISILLTVINCASIKDNFIRYEVNEKNIGEQRKWWEAATFYQIYPRSFKDNNNDGIGDLKGVIEKLPHLKELGVTGTWLSPIFKSPQVDQGYDISDYKSIDPIFGTMEDMDRLLEEAKKLGIKIIMDFVPNHTSDQHQWFINSVNRVEGYEDFYVWRNATFDENGKRQPPNNWISNFRGSAWTYNEKRDQYYLHQFASLQPDLNYRNPAVVSNMTDVLTFWMNKGVSGFRIDAVSHIIEDAGFKDEPRSDNENATPDDYGYLKHIYTKDIDENFEVIYMFREHMDNYTAQHGGEERIIMTEAYSSFDKLLRYFASLDGSKMGAQFSFNFDMLGINKNSRAKDLQNIFNKWNAKLPDYVHRNWVLGNHDQHRMATRVGAENVDGYNMLISLLRGVQITYNGEEFGMENGPVKCEEGQDPSAIKNCTTYPRVSRDFERTPFQWDNSTNAGFNKGAKPWLPVNPAYLKLNLENQRNVEKSHFEIYKKLQKIRKDFFTIQKNEGYGLISLNSNVVQLVREAKDENGKYIYSYYVVFNMGDQKETVNLVAPDNKDAKFVVLVAGENSSRKNGDTIESKALRLDPHEALLLQYVS